MPEPTIDAEQFRERQRALWDSVALGWQRWWPKFEDGAAAVSERMVELCGAAPGQRVLDVATGIGEPALRLARRVGPTGRVLAIDLAPQMLLLARQRAQAAGLDNIEFREMDMERPELERASFQAATWRWGPMLMRDPVAALVQLRLALARDARLATAVWGSGKDVPFIAIPGDIAERVAGIEKPPPGTPGPLCMGRVGELEAALTSAGFRGIEVEEHEVVLRFESSAEYVQFVQDISATLRRMLEEGSAEVRERTWSAIGREAERWAVSGGGLVFVNRVRVASARA